MVSSWRGGPRAPANPWKALTIEWQVSSPPPVFNFDHIPTVVGGPYEYGVPGAVHAIFKPDEAPTHGPRHGRQPVTTRLRRRGPLMANVLVLANETIGGAGAARRDPRAPRRRATRSFFLVVPQTKPKYGNVIYDEAVRDFAQVRVDLALAFMRQEGIEGQGEVGDSDPYNAAMDAIAAHRIDEAIVSTHPVDLVGLAAPRPARAHRRPPPASRSSTSRSTSPTRACRSTVTLVVANQTVAGGALLDRLKALAAESPAALHRRRAAELR